MGVKVAPSILAADFAAIGQGVRLAEECGADYIHCDVMDGMFVPNISFGAQMIRAVRRLTSVPLDVHLMIESPERYITQFADAGADIISIHAEATQHIQRVLAAIRECGKKAGLVLNPATPLDYVRYVLDDVDLVLLMTVNPGYGGQTLVPAMVDKVAKLHEMFVKHDKEEVIELEVDGGISQANAPKLVEAGANVFVVGSAFFGAPDPKRALTLLKEAR